MHLYVAQAERSDFAFERLGISDNCKNQVVRPDMRMRRGCSLPQPGQK